MKEIQLVPIAPEQIEVLNIRPPALGTPALGTTASGGILTHEVTVLRGAFHLTAQCLARHANPEPGDDYDRSMGMAGFYTGLLCRLSDSIVRAMLAAHRLARTDYEMARFGAEVKRVIREMGFGEQP
jgi:hypothetical protein